MKLSGKLLVGLALCTLGAVQASAQMVDNPSTPIILAKKKSPAIWLVLGGLAAMMGVIVEVSSGSDKPASP